MKFSPLTLGGAALALLLTTATARAELIPWMYSWSSTPGVIHADAPGTSYVTLTDEPLALAVGDSDIVATNLRTFSTAASNSPDHFTHANYSLSLYLYDPTSHQSKTIVFTGYLDGTLSESNSNITNTFTGITAQTVQLGQQLYTASALSYTPPGIPGSINSGSISGHITIKVEAVMTPEPGTLALSGVGLLMLGVARLRRKRSARERRAT
jgi:phosphoketolase